MVELLKQDQYEPLRVEQQIVSLFAGVNGLVDDVPVEVSRDFAKELVQYIDTRYPQLGNSIIEAREITPETQDALRQAIAEFKTNFTVKAGAA
jgi:F-type H+-transporting ATPase subunit alpha